MIFLGFNFKLLKMMSVTPENELEHIQEELERLHKRLSDFRDEVREERTGYISKIREEKKMCGDECLRELEKHLEICDGGYEKDHPNYGRSYYKCEIRSVCYECNKSHNIEKNGRCSHYYEIKHLDEKLENIEEYDEKLQDRIIDLEVEYERKLAIKEGRYEQYKEDLYDDY
jgi:hypothetical protein